MSEALAQVPATAPAPQWLTIAQASKLSGKNEGHLRRLCGEKWLAEGKAKTEKSQWLIRADADPSFQIAPSPAAAVPAADFRALPAKSREIAQDRARILSEWQKAVSAGMALGLDRNAATKLFLERLPADSRPSRATLYNWSSAHKRDGLLGLVDGRKGSSTEEADDPFLAEVERYWLDQRKRKISLCYEMALVTARERGWKICAYRSAHRHIQRLIKRKPGVVTQLREGESAFTDKIERFLNRTYIDLGSNEFWNADHHVFDVLVQVDEKLNPNTGEKVPVYARPWLTAWQDMRSRKIVGWLIRRADPNTDAIIEALRRACVTHHLPATAYTDNGKDFDCRDLTGETKAMRWKRRTLHVDHDQKRLGGIYGTLGVEHIHCWPWHGQSKPIERFFGTLEDRFGRTFDTYCGSTPQNKPEDLPEQLARGRAPTLERFIALFEEWLELGYHQRLHSGESMDCTPAQAWDANLISARKADPELLEVALQRRVGPLSVGQNGVVYNRLWFGQYDLAKYHGQQVYLTIGDGLNEVGVWSIDGAFLCRTTPNRKIPVNADHAMLRAALKEKQHANKALRAARQARLRIAEDIPDAMLRAAADQAGRTAQRPELPIPPSITPVRTGFEDQLPAMRAAIPLKKAVGDDTPAPRFNYQSKSSQDDSATDGPIGFTYRAQEASDD